MSADVATTVMRALARDSRVNTSRMGACIGRFKHLGLIIIRNSLLLGAVFKTLQGLHSFVEVFAEIVSDVSQHRTIELLDGVASVRSLKGDIRVGDSELSDLVFGVQNRSAFG